MSRRNARPFLLGALFLLSACAQEGDFGRPSAGVWNGLVDTTGAIAARGRGEPSSLLPFTDDEQTLRDRAWRFLMPADRRAAFVDVLANLTRARVLPPGWRGADVEAYYDDLVAGPFRSPVSRYAKLSEDATADGRLVPPFAATAQRVIEADALRLRSLPLARSLNEDDLREAAMRVAENRCLIAWARAEAALRVGRYRFALEHLLAGMPSGREALAAERTIAFFDSRRGLLSGLLPPEAEARCGFGLPVAPVAAAEAGAVVAKY